MRDFNISKFLTDGKLVLKDQRIENCRLVGMQYEEAKIANCIFKNVVFQNHIKKSFQMKECEFFNCEFHDTFGDYMFNDDTFSDILLDISDSIFTECLFENISYYGAREQSDIVNNKFLNCIFINIHIKGDITFSDLTYSGGKIEHSSYVCNNISGSQFLNTQMQDVNIRMGAYYNEIKNVVFNNVILTGNTHRNKFVDCDTSGFTSVETYT